MRPLFIAATSLFWLAVMVFAVAGTSNTTAATGPASTSVDKRFTLTEVAQHATEADCWMAINGTVYDFTAYLPDHPSRPSDILPWCGKEASEAYKTKTKGRPHSPAADQMLPRYRIGVLAQP